MSGGPWPDLGTTLDDLPDDLRARIKAELAPGERLLWAAKGEVSGPAPGLGTLIGVLVAGLFLTFGIFALDASGIRGRPEGPSEYPLVAGMLMTIVGVLVALAMFGVWTSRRSRRRMIAGTLYALTDQRAILWRPVAGTRALAVHTMPRGSLKKVHRLELPDGSGTVIFTSESGPDPWEPYEFAGVREVRRVEDLARRTLFRSESPPIA